jgi:hypothetical protein
MLHRTLTAVALAVAITSIAAPAPAATTYQSVTLTVPVTIDSMPLGTTAKVSCSTPTVGAPTSYVEAVVPVQTVGGFVVYHGPPIVLVLKPNSGGPPGGPNTPNLVTGAYIGCEVSWSPSSPTDPAKSKYSTYSVQLQ